MDGGASSSTLGRKGAAPSPAFVQLKSKNWKPQNEPSGASKAEIAKVVRFYDALLVTVERENQALRRWAETLTWRIQELERRLIDNKK